MLTKDSHYHPVQGVSPFTMSRSKFQSFRIILLTSLFWVFIDAFLIFYLTDCGASSGSASQALRCEIQLEKTQLQLVQLQKDYAKLVRQLPGKEDEGEDEPKDKNYDDELEARNKRLHKIHNMKKDNEKLDPDQHNAITTDQNRPGFFDKIKDWFKEDHSAEPTNPPFWPGENGRGVVIPDNLKKESETRFKENQFNIVASDLIALNRSVPDQRSDACRNREYPVDLPTTSIIIVYHNEGNTTLLRGLMSIVRKSPAKYLKEIILVDDHSEDREYLHGPLDEFVKHLPVRVKIIRNTERLGLMRSRLRGAEAATGDTMTFLDAHIECTNGWLPPLLYEIKKNRQTVVSPIIDVISDENFAYLSGSEGTYGGFSHKMIFRWIPIPEREHRRRGGDKSLPARTPTMAGGLFTIDREYFYEIGTYDEGMDIWGAENLEMSFRVWMCGGTLLIIPCSHVGHVFRKQTPYSFPGGTNKIIFKNNRRLVDVWTDEYVKYFHKVIPDLNTVEAGDISSRLELRKTLNCKNFKWYLDNIYMEAPVPRDFFHLGSVANVGLNFCIDTMGRKDGQDAGATFCHGQGGNQIFEYSKTHQLATGALCLDTNGSPGVVKMNTCNKGSKSQQWDYDNMSQHFRNKHTSSCLSISENNNNVLVTTNCDPSNTLQQWTFKDPIMSFDS